MVSEYSKNAQLIVTSHSPALFGLRFENCSIYRVFSDDSSTLVAPVNIKGLARKIDKGQQAILEQELGLMEFQERWQREYESRLAALEMLREEVRSTMDEITSANMPVVVTEGKWDVEILTHAWEALYSGQMPYKIISCDTTNSSDGGSAGADMLRMCLTSARPDQPIAIGVFDRDKHGVERGFDRLGANFTSDSECTDIKVQSAGACAAVLLPIASGREAYAEVQNLSIEFLFGDETLSQRVNGKGLNLEYPRVSRVVHGSGHKLPEVTATEDHLRQIDDSSKAAFACDVVPTLPDEAFGEFEELFDRIERGIKLTTLNRSN